MGRTTVPRHSKSATDYHSDVDDDSRALHPNYHHCRFQNNITRQEISGMFKNIYACKQQQRKINLLLSYKIGPLILDTNRYNES